MLCIHMQDQAHGDAAEGNYDNWLDAYDSSLRHAQNTEKYVVALYWALATVSTIGCGVYMYMCVCVCIYIYIYTHTHIYIIYIYRYGDVLPLTDKEYVCVCLSACLSVCMYSCMYIHMYTCVHIYTCICVYIYTYRPTHTNTGTETCCR